MEFLITRTYAESTYESREHGEHSETGVVFEDQLYTLSELKEYIKDEGFTREKGCNWLENGWNTICYREGIGRNDSLFVKHVTRKETT